MAEIGKIVKQLRDEGISILLVEQNLTMALSIAERLYVMNKGRVVFEGTPDELQAQNEIMVQYLGV